MFFNSIPATVEGVIEILIKLWSSEIVASHGYRQHALKITGPYAKTISDELNEHADDENKHAHILQDLIGDLGGSLPTKVGDVPFLTFNRMDSRTATSLEGMLSEDLQGEEGAIEAYGEAIELLKNTDWFDIVVILAKIRREEREHRRELMDLLGPVAGQLNAQ